MKKEDLKKPGGNAPAGDVLLREIQEDDLDIFFEQQKDPQANYMAAFTQEDAADRDAFEAHWNKIMHDDTIKIKTILYKGETAGSVLSYVQSGETEVSYWLGKAYWGKGIASAALKAFLEIQKTRPLYARAARDNTGSIRVLEKNGFVPAGIAVGYANARGMEIEEVIMRLE